MAYRRCQAENLIPVVLDHTCVDAIGEQLVERTVVILRRSDREQALVEHVADAGRKPKPKRGTQPEHVHGVTGGIGEVLLDMQVGLVVAQTVDDVQRFAIVGADDLGVEWQTKVSSVAVDRRPAAWTKVRRIAIGVRSIHRDSDAHAVG